MPLLLRPPFEGAIVLERVAGRLAMYPYPPGMIHPRAAWGSDTP